MGKPDIIFPELYQSLYGVKGAESLLRKQYNGTYKAKLQETISTFRIQGKIEVITDPTQLTYEDYERRSELISQDGTMINKSPEELQQAHGVCVIKQGGKFLGGIGAWSQQYKPIIGESVTIFQRGSLVVDPDLRGIEIGSYLIERINLLYQQYPMYGVSLVKAVADANRAIGNHVYTVRELQAEYSGFANYLEHHRGKNFNYLYQEDAYLGHYIMMNQKLHQILQQDKNYAISQLRQIDMQLASIPVPDAQSA